MAHHRRTLKREPTPNGPRYRFAPGVWRQNGAVRRIRNACQYSEGILKEHQHTRANAGLFDVSHMWQVELLGEGAAVHLEALVPEYLRPCGKRNTLHQFTNDCGGLMTLWSQMPGTDCYSSLMRHAERRIFNTFETVCG